MNDSAIRILRTANAVRDLLLEKNEAYGDSALEPSNIFAKGSAVENICCRIDDKLMRIKNKGINDSTEDTIQDLIGYLILLKIAVEDERTRTINNHISEYSTHGETFVHNDIRRTPKNLDWWETSTSSSASQRRPKRSEEEASGDPMGG
jgi:hypothetical protein